MTSELNKITLHKLKKLQLTREERESSQIAQKWQFVTVVERESGEERERVQGEIERVVFFLHFLVYL